MSGTSPISTTFIAHTFAQTLTFQLIMPYFSLFSLLSSSFTLISLFSLSVTLLSLDFLSIRTLSAIYNPYSNNANSINLAEYHRLCS